MNNPEVKKLVEEKIYPKYITEQVHESRRDIPIWLKHCDKSIAEELRNPCGSYSQLSENEREQQFPYFFWLSKSQESYTEKPQKCKNFGKDFPEFLKELESIVRERERERERNCCSRCGKKENDLKDSKCKSCRSKEREFSCSGCGHYCKFCGRSTSYGQPIINNVCLGEMNCRLEPKPERVNHNCEYARCKKCSKKVWKCYFPNFRNWKNWVCPQCGWWENWQKKQQELGKSLKKIQQNKTLHTKIYSHIRYNIFGDPTMGYASVPGTNSGAGIPKTWQCSQCKVKKTWIYIPDFNDEQTVEQKLANKHKCLTCPKCNKLSSYEDLAIHENFECSTNPLNQSQINQNNQLLANIRQSLQTTIQDIQNDPNLTQQQKNDLVNNLSPAVSNLQKLLDDLEEKQKKISSSGDNQNKSTNWTPWIIGGMVLILVLLVIGIILYWKKRED